MVAIAIISSGCPAAMPDSLPVFLFRLYCLAMEQRPSIVNETPKQGLSGEDAIDVVRAQDGDADAFARLVRRHQAAVAVQMWRFSRDPREHAELVQDVFVNAWRGLSGYKAKAPFLHWLRKIAVRTGYAFWRVRAERRVEVEWDDQVAVPVVEDVDPAESAAKAVHAVLAELPPRDRLVLTLVYLDGRSLAEVADLLGWSLALVKVQAWRARSKLKKRLEAFNEL